MTAHNVCSKKYYYLTLYFHNILYITNINWDENIKLFDDSYKYIKPIKYNYILNQLLLNNKTNELNNIMNSYKLLKKL